MRKDDQLLANDPDLYSRELHYQLLITGPKSQGVRRLMRLARKHPGGELERILETKINEYKRHQRDSRVPSLWNLPARSFEWASDHVALTPSLDVVLTLVYVVIALVGVEVIKRFIWQEPPLDREVSIAASAGTKEVSIYSDAELDDEVRRASRTEAFADVLRSQLRALISEGHLKGQSPNDPKGTGLIRTYLQVEVDTYLKSQEFRDSVRNMVSKEGALMTPKPDLKPSEVDEEVSKQIATRLYAAVLSKASQAEWASANSDTAREALVRKLVLEMTDEIRADEALLAEVSGLVKEIEDRRSKSTATVQPAIAEKPTDPNGNAGGN